MPSVSNPFGQSRDGFVGSKEIPLPYTWLNPSTRPRLVIAIPNRSNKRVGRQIHQRPLVPRVTQRNPLHSRRPTCSNHFIDALTNTPTEFGRVLSSNSNICAGGHRHQFLGTDQLS
jgi:hypothetical protein